jgi:hypothetical protein
MRKVILHTHEALTLGWPKIRAELTGGLPWITIAFERFATWMANGLVGYLAYGARHSKLNR